MKVHIITRFSICDAHVKGFQITKNTSVGDYERALFDPARLRHKFEVFERVTVPSITGQSSDDWEWHIYTSDRLPLEFDRRLERLADSDSRIRVFRVRDFHEFSEQVVDFDYGDDFATARLDDDDGLSEHYIAKLQHYASKRGCIVSFPTGHSFELKDGRIRRAPEKVQRLVSAGMAAIGMNIYQCGSHKKVDLNYDVIYDYSPAMYLQDCSEFCDTNRRIDLGLRRPLTKFRRKLTSGLQSIGRRVSARARSGND